MLIHWTLHGRGLFCTPYIQINPVKRIILESKLEMCKWFIFSYYIFFWFFYIVNIHKLWEHILKLIVPSIILASPSTILFVVREITRMQLESVWECANIYYSIQCMCLENCTRYQIWNIQTNYCTIQYFKLKTCTTIGPWRHHRVSNEKQLVRRYRWWPVANQFCLTHCKYPQIMRTYTQIDCPFHYSC
jgi:hypothetical protein